MNSLVIKNSVSGEILNEETEINLNSDQVKVIVEHFPNNSYGCFFNKTFDEFNFVFVLNGKWKFFDSRNEVILDWCWYQDILEIINNYANDADNDGYIEFFEGWSFYDNDEYPENLEEFFAETLESECFSVPVKDILLQDAMTLQEKGMVIMNTSTLTDEEKVQQILALSKH